jgi:hypothetical protein
LIHAEGTPDDEHYPNFNLEDKWLTEDDLTKRNGAWNKSGGTYYFNEEMRHLFHYEYDLIKFALEEIEVN